MGRGRPGYQSGDKVPLSSRRRFFSPTLVRFAGSAVRVIVLGRFVMSVVARLVGPTKLCSSIEQGAFLGYRYKYREK